MFSVSAVVMLAAEAIMSSFFVVFISTGFKRGQNARIRRLKKYLLGVYGDIGQSMNDHSYYKRYYEANVQICDGLQHRRLDGDVNGKGEHNYLSNALSDGFQHRQLMAKSTLSL